MRHKTKPLIHISIAIMISLVCRGFFLFPYQNDGDDRSADHHNCGDTNPNQPSIATAIIIFLWLFNLDDFFDKFLFRFGAIF